MSKVFVKHVISNSIDVSRASLMTQQ